MSGWRAGVVLGLLVAALGMSAGCAAVLVAGGAAAGAGGYAWYDGELRESLAGSLSAVNKAVKKTLSDQGATAIEDIGNEGERDIRATLADAKPVHIHLKAASKDVTEVKVRIGTFGDEKRSQLLVDEIRGRI